MRERKYIRAERLTTAREGGRDVSARDVVARILTRPSVYQGALPPMALRQADAILSALSESGYAVVPAEPTVVMVQAAAQLDFSAQHDPTWPEYYRAMIAAAQETGA